MKTIVLEEPGRFRLVETGPPGRPGPGEALVRVRRVGICGTDLHAFAGNQNFLTYPRVLGHELGVEVAAIGPGGPDLAWSIGDRCCVIPYYHCGRCIACRRGKTNCCVAMQVLGVHVDGGMCELIKAPLENLLKSEILPLDHLALVEMLSIGAHAVRRAQLEPDETVLVIGAGPIGLSTLEFARLLGARVMVLELNERRLEFCRRQLGLETVIDGKREPLLQLHEILEGELPTAVFDATGSAGSMMKAFDYTAHGGKLIFVGHFPGEVTFHDPDFHQRELTLLGSRNATPADFRWVMEALEAGKIDVTAWITHRVSPEEIIKQFPGWLDPAAGVVKAMLEFEPETWNVERGA